MESVTGMPWNMQKEKNAPLSCKIDLFGELIGGEFGGAALEHDASVAQDIDVIGDAERDRNVVLHQQKIQ